MNTDLQPVYNPELKCFLANPTVDYTGIDRYYLMRDVFGMKADEMVELPDGERVTVNQDGTTHVTVYSPETNERISVDIDKSGNEVQGSLHYTNQNVEKGDDQRHSH